MDASGTDTTESNLPTFDPLTIENASYIMSALSAVVISWAFTRIASDVIEIVTKYNLMPPKRY